jgi:hypothetical protein
MRRLNYDTLNIILAGQRLRSFIIADSAIREAAGQETPSWFRSAESYYSEIPDCVMKVAGLHKNRSDFEGSELSDHRRDAEDEPQQALAVRIPG